MTIFAAWIEADELITHLLTEWDRSAVSDVLSEYDTETNNILKYDNLSLFGGCAHDGVPATAGRNREGGRGNDHGGEDHDQGGRDRDANTANTADAVRNSRPDPVVLVAPVTGLSCDRSRPHRLHHHHFLHSSPWAAGCVGTELSSATWSGFSTGRYKHKKKYNSVLLPEFIYFSYTVIRGPSMCRLKTVPLHR